MSYRRAMQEHNASINAAIKATHKEGNMAKFKLGAVYKITQGLFDGQTKLTCRVSKCGQYAWFWDTVSQSEIRVHIKHTDGADPDATKPLPGDVYAEKVASEMEVTRAIAFELVSARDMKRIKEFKFRIKSRTATIAEEIHALEDVTGEYPQLIPNDVLAFLLGVGVVLTALVFAVSITAALGIL